MLLCSSENPYCLLLEREGGLELLKNIINDPRPYADIKKLATQVIARCKKYKIMVQNNPEADMPDVVTDDEEDQEDDANDVVDVDANDVVDSGDEEN